MKAGVITLLHAAAAMLLAVGAQAAETRFDAATVARGRYLATASDCIACHTAHKGAPMAGGLALASPVGEIVSTNITPSKAHGIGNYTEQQFADALRKGVRADGQPLYPAMPYTAYTIMTDADVHALYAYFMQGVAPVEKTSRATELPFPMNIRASMGAWNALFLDRKPLPAAATQSVEWLRGRYLADGAAHCSTCHTPRGVLMEEKKELNMAGNQVGAWYAPNITSDARTGIGSWTEAELAQYLRTGRVEGKAQAAGSMAEAVSYSFSHLDAADLKAIAVYIKTIPPVESGASRFNQGQPGNALDSIRGKGYTAGMQGATLGAQVFSANCAACHGANAQGSREGYYPSLFHNSATVATSNLLATILFGVDRETQDGHVFMPPFGHQVNAVNQLSDEQVAALANYLQAGYGGGASVKPGDVATIRNGGPQSHLVLLARLGIAAGVLVLVLLVMMMLRRRRVRNA
jgi:mono/diheme cytochrome c family protein